jgi:alpha-D-ribose 1-methylphosphonate 5-triphosphate synthase subunit PhnH
VFCKCEVSSLVKPEVSALGAMLLSVCSFLSLVWLTLALADKKAMTQIYLRHATVNVENPNQQPFELHDV